MTSHEQRPDRRRQGAETSNRGADEPPWTAERIRALGAVTNVTTAANIFRVSRSVAYDLVKHGRFPVTVLRFGSHYRVPVAAILQALRLPADADEPPDARPPNPT